MFQRFQTYLREVWLEMGKVTWPTRSELKESTIVVIIASFLLTLFIFIVDWIVRLGVDGITSLRVS